MDRKTVYYGQLPLETDVLLCGQYAMVGLAKLSEAILGTSTALDGFAVAPTSPASLNVTLGPGSIYQLENLEQSTWSSLGADLAHSILKQGILLDPVTIGITPPSTVGYSQVFLVEVEYQDLDTGATVLPYYNASNPSLPFNGPANAGTSQNTVRRGAVAYQIKAGVAAPTGTQVAPTADAGWTGIYRITVANGATTITSGNINQTINPPFISPKLPQVPLFVQSGIWEYAVDIGSRNAISAIFNPVITTLTPGMTVRIKKMVNDNNGPMVMQVSLATGTNPFVRADGSDFNSGDLKGGMIIEATWDGARWMAVNYFGLVSSTSTVNNFNTISIPNAVDSGSANAVVAAFSPALVSLATGNIIEIKIAARNTGATTVTPNSMSPVTAKRTNGDDLYAGDLLAGMTALFVYDGTYLQLLNPAGRSRTLFYEGAAGAYSWTCPIGVARVYARGRAAGGGGNCSVSGVNGSAGGQGGQFEGVFDVVPGTAYAIIVGPGGLGSTAGNDDGTNGGSTSFASFGSANGGLKGVFVSVTGVAQDGGAGGTATGGQRNITGQKGQATNANANSNYPVGGGNGGSNGSNGVVPGSGGGPGTSTTPAGAGAGGELVLEYAA
jgi:hypothetical protein